MPFLKITTSDGEHEVELAPTSTLSVETGDARFAVSDVVSVETLAEATPAPEPTPEAPAEVTAETVPADGSDANTATVPEFASAEEALAHVHTLATVDEVVPVIAAALEKWPEDAGLLEVKERVDEIAAAKTAAA